ncbi:MAG: T9SS type A sorting domain-containing protein, partial [Bacteroidia bacterium]|nr:T9SS type A sorting domain-containing protein [Bacteroidia bacterium]
TSDGGLGTITFNGTGAQTYSVASGAPRTCKIAVNKTSGGVSPAGGTNDFYMQGFTQTLGDFTAPTGIMNVGGALQTTQTIFSHVAGTFTHNNGTTVFNPIQSSGANATYTVDIINTTVFNNVTVNETQSWGTATLASGAGDTLDVVDDLVFTDGRSTAVFEVAGNVTVQSGHDGGNGLLIFKNGNSQSFDLTGATTNFDGDIKVRKTANNVSLMSDLQMDAANQDLFLVKGDMVVPSLNMIIIGDNVTATGGSDSSFVDGRVRKIGNDAFTFPIGKNDTAYAPISITAPTNVAHHFTAEYFQVDPNPSYDVTSKVASLDHLSRCEYWILDRTNGASNVLVTLSWGDRSCGVTALADLRVARWDGTQWQDHGNGLTTGTTASGTVRSSAAVTSFSPFTLSSTTVNNPLPIELLSFNAIPNGKKVDLNWSTASEKNNDFFTIERSKDAQLFEFVAHVDGAGNSSELTDYVAVDPQPFSGISYYRLKQTDFNGEYSYSRIVAVEFSSSIQDFLIYPNPADAQDGFIIELSTFFETYELTIMDVAGKKLYEYKGNEQRLQVNEEFAPGVYFIQYSDSESRTINKKMIIK